MGNKRMFSKVIVCDAEFLEMTTGAKCLYFFLGMHTDDEGVVSNPKAIMKMCGCRNSDLELLKKKRYVLELSEKCVVLKHHFANNNRRSDRDEQSTYHQELQKFVLDSRNFYTEKEKFGNQMATNGNHNINKKNINKDKVNKERKKVSKKENVSSYDLVLDKYIFDNELKNEFKEWIKSRILNKKKLTDHAVELQCKKVLGFPEEKRVVAVRNSIMNGWMAIYEPKEDIRDKAREAFIKKTEQEMAPKRTRLDMMKDIIKKGVNDESNNPRKVITDKSNNG